jgi:hypothetical protein
MADLVAIGREAGALRSPGSLPSPVDIVIVGGGTDGGGPEHAWTLLETTWAGYDGRVLDVGLDGGQRDGDGAECIRVVEHVLREGWDQTERSTRRVRWVVDVEGVVARFGRGDVGAAE